MEAYDLKTLPKGGETLDVPLAPEWLTARLNDPADLELTVHDPGRAQLSIRRVHANRDDGLVVRVKGEVSATVETPCVRCLEPLTLALHGKVDRTLFPAALEPDEDEDEARDDEEPLTDLDEDTYAEMTLDLPEIVRESLLLDLDMNPTCADEGACEARLARLLALAGPSPEDAIDPRWAALARIRLKSDA